MIAAAWATTAAYLSMALALYLTAQKFYPITYDWGSIVRMGLLAAGLFFLWHSTEALQVWWAQILLLCAYAAGLLLLAGRTDDAVGLVDATDDVGWDSGRHPAPVVVPFLLVGASNACHYERWDDSLMLELLDRANNAGWPHDRLRSDDGLDTLLTTLAEQEPRAIGHYRAATQDDLLLSTLLTARLKRHPPAAAERRRWLSTGRRLVDARIDAVVGGQHRAAYASVAHLAAACAEAIALAIAPDNAGGYLDELHTRYPRHSLFRRELRTITAQSPLLG
jgi:hypothetical protein